MNFFMDKQKNKSYLIYKLSEDERTDPTCLGMMSSNHIPGLSDLELLREHDERSLRYDITDCVCMKDLFEQPVNRRCLLTTFSRIIDAMNISAEYMIDPNSLVLELEHIFVHPETYDVRLICMPIKGYFNGNQAKNFFKTVMFNTQFDQGEACDHVAVIMNYLNSNSSFQLDDFKAILTELGGGASTITTTEETPSPSAADDPFAGIELFAQNQIPDGKKTDTKKPEYDFLTDFNPEATAEETKVDPLAAADALLSAALAGQAPKAEPATVSAPTSSDIAAPKTASKPSEEPFAEEIQPDAGRASRRRRSRSRTDENDLLSLAAKGLQSENSTMGSKSSVSEPESARSRSRRSRSAASSDRIELPDFRESSSGENPSANHRSAALREADALLSGLELEPKKNPRSNATEEDPLAGFGAPPSRNRKSDALREADALLSALELEPKKNPRNEATEEDPLAGFGAPLSRNRKSDALREADALLSALELEPKKNPRSNATEEDPLAGFGSPPSRNRKSDALREAEAILDSLDFTAPPKKKRSDTEASQQMKSETAEKNESPSFFIADPETIRQNAERREDASSEKPKKSGFFSKLRKKEDAPAQSVQESQSEKASANPVAVPYYGNSGETTVLNVAQMSARQNAPHLVRSANKETIYLSKPVFRIGKDKSYVDYCIIDNSAISRRHANFIARNGDIYVVDTNSTNHTYVNGVQIRSNAEVKLTHGDEVRLANEDFTFYCADMN